MGKRLMVSVPVTPIGKPRMTQRDRWKNRPVVVRYHRYCDDLRWHLPQYTLPGELHLQFMMPMPPSWSRKKRNAMVGAPHTQKPDIDNLAKSFMDAFKTEDSHVNSIRAEKVWAELGSIEV